MLPFLISYAWPIILLLIGWSVGRVKIRNHRAHLKRSENQLQTIRLHNVKYRPVDTQQPVDAYMLTSSIVLSIDIFQRFLAGFRGFLGGEHNNYTDLLDRGRRDALLRLQAQAQKLGAQDIYNIKIQSASSGASRGIEILAYGTAIKTL